MTSRVEGKPYALYVMWSESGRCFYIGISEDPELRLRQHNEDERAGWTSRHRPWSLVHVEWYSEYTGARRRELELKRQKGGAGFFAKTGLDAARFRQGS
jgi:putative endonuclease